MSFNIQNSKRFKEDDATQLDIFYVSYIVNTLCLQVLHRYCVYILIYTDLEVKRAREGKRRALKGCRAN